MRQERGRKKTTKRDRKLARGKVSGMVRVQSHSVIVRCFSTGPLNSSLWESRSWAWGRRSPKSAAPMAWLSRAQGKKFRFPYSHLRNRAVTIIPVTRQQARHRAICPAGKRYLFDTKRCEDMPVITTNQRNP